MMDIRDLKTKAAKLLKEGRDVITHAEKESRGLLPDEKVKHSKIMEDWAEVRSEIQIYESQETAEKRAAEEAAKAEDRADNTTEPETRGDKGKPESRHETAEYEDAFERYLRKGETRALQADSDIYGGYTVMPRTLAAGLLTAKDNMVWMRGLATLNRVETAASLGIISLDNDPADPAWTAEIGSASEDSTTSFGGRELNPHQLTKLLKISEKLLRMSSYNIAELVQNRLAYKFAVTEENVFLNGTGARQPLGIFTASDNGITTSQDVTCSDSATPESNFTFVDLKNVKYDLPMQYRASQSCAWVAHRDFFKMAAVLQDGNSNFIWQPSVVVGEPDRLLGYPCYESEYAPSTFTTGLYIAVLGDFSYYYIADALNLSIQRLNELYAVTNQVGFIGRAETDGMPVLAAAFRRVKLG